MISFLPARVFQDTTELDVSTLSDEDLYTIILKVNSLWERIDTTPVKYRCIPMDGQLYVAAGTFDECRCSYSEVNLYNPWDLDDHHFIYCAVPDDLKSMLIELDDGQEGFLLEEYHPTGVGDLTVYFD